MLWSTSEVPSWDKVRDIFSHSPEYRNGKAHGGQFTSKQLLLDPAHARRVTSIRTSAAFLTPQHLLADRLTAWTQTGWRQAISNCGITFFSIAGFFCWACPEKAGKLLINIPFRVASSAECFGWKDCWFNCSNLNFQGKKMNTLFCLAALTQVCIVDQVWLNIFPLGYCNHFCLLKYYHVTTTRTFYTAKIPSLHAQH